jgi:hypothetical protein
MDGKTMTRAPKRKPATSRGGIGIFLFVIFALMGGAGLALDLMSRPPGAFWIAAEPGARALIGIAAAAFMLACAHGARFLLATREHKGERDAGDHA